MTKSRLPKNYTEQYFFLKKIKIIKFNKTLKYRNKFRLLDNKLIVYKFLEYHRFVVVRNKFL